MTIDVFSKYRVTKYIKYSYVDEEQSEPSDYVYGTHEQSYVLNIDGGKLLDMISDLLKNTYIISSHFDKNSITVETFQPLNGTGDYIKLEIERIDENVSS